MPLLWRTSCFLRNTQQSRWVRCTLLVIAMPAISSGCGGGLLATLSTDALQVNGGQLPPHVLPFCCAAGALAALLPISSFLLQRHRDQLTHQDLASPIQKPARLATILQTVLPSGIGFGVGMYVSPQWTLPRVIGSIVEQTWLVANPRSHANLMVVIASGLVLGEGTASIVTACLKAFS